LVLDCGRAGADPAAADAVPTAEQTFGIALLQQLNRSDDGSNLVASRPALQIALAMLEIGAGEQTLGPARRSRSHPPA
jgi:hypothetical protein